MRYFSRSNGGILVIPWVITARFGYQRGNFLHILVCDRLKTGKFVTIVTKFDQQNDTTQRGPNHVAS